METIKYFVTAFLLMEVRCSPIAENTEIVDVKFLQFHDHERIRRDVSEQSVMPDHILTSFSHRGADIILRLRRIPNLPTNIVRETGVDEFKSASQESAVYVDPTLAAAVIARRDGPDQFWLEGNLEHNGRKLSLTPMLRHKRSPPSGNNGNPHVIAVVAEKIDFGSDALPPHRSGHRNAAAAAARRQKRQAGSTTVHTVETVFVVDNSDYRNWVAKFPTGTLDRLVEYYTLIAHSMNNIYGSVKEVNSALDIRVTVIQLYVLETAAMSEFSEDAIAATGGGPIEGGDYLDNFRDWIPTKSGQGLVQNADHYMAFTAYDIVLSGGSAVGVARKGEVCEVDSVSVVESSDEDGNYKASTANIGAHELGHCLSASHDGEEDAAACSRFSQYVMTPTLLVPLQYTAAEPQNIFDFSECSVNAFQNYLSTVSCTLPANTESTSVLTSQVLPNYVTDRDETCKLLTGLSNSYRCTFGPDESEICTGMLCFTFFNGTHTFCDYVLPFEGTPCGTDKVCYQGLCLDETAVPTPAPTNPPTQAPTNPPTQAPTNPPTEAPTNPPTQAPTNPPTQAPTNPPTEAPTNPPTEAPTNPPTEAPTNPPTEAPTNPPTEAPTNPPTEAPTNPPTQAPTNPPTQAPTNPPTEAPTNPPTEAPTNPPTEAPTNPPTEAPTNPPTQAPTNPPTQAPTNPPTEAPTNPPTQAPTNPPTQAPTNPPTETPTNPPTEAPTNPPTEAPTNPPTEAPTNPPTEAPTNPPTEAPTNPPTEAPTNPPTQAPTNPPTEAPTNPPTEAPTNPPTEAPTNPPTQAPTNPPTEAPTNPPTQAPTNPPTEAPTNPPTEAPTNPPTEAPTNPPTEAPTNPPTEAPTNPPTEAPTNPPTEAPTNPPTEAPTNPPTEAPTNPPTQVPTNPPTEAPTNPPTEAPTNPPTQAPTNPTTTTPAPADPTTTQAPKPPPRRCFKKKYINNCVRRFYRSLNSGSPCMPGGCLPCFIFPDGFVIEQC